MNFSPTQQTLFILCLLSLCACGANPAKEGNGVTNLVGASSSSLSNQAASFAASPQKEKRILAKIYQQYHNWKDAPYRWGGLSRKGLDCSGLVYLTFRNQFGIHLPRTTLDQVKRGRHVERSHLRAGDLLFFSTGKNLNHVGIYLENKQFLHVSTKKGVMISSIDNGYWSKRYWQSRRLL